MSKLIFLILLFFFSQIVWAEDCTMRPAPIDFKKITRQPAVKSYTVNTNKLGLTALLKNGSAVKLAHMGCAHSGAALTEWFESELSTSDIDKVIKESISLAKIFLDPHASSLIEQNLLSKKFSKEITSNRLVISGSANEIFSYSIIFTPVEHGVMLSIDYSIAG
jgi:hypothetical protein